MLNDLQRAQEESPEEECQVNTIKKSILCILFDITSTKQSKREQTSLTSLTFLLLQEPGGEPEMSMRGMDSER